MGRKMSLEIYINGCSGIISPVDMHGNQIKAGDKLSWDFGDPYYQKNGVEEWMKKAIFVVVPHESGSGLCAVGIEKKLYLHDFRFKYCELVTG